MANKIYFTTEEKNFLLDLICGLNEEEKQTFKSHQNSKSVKQEKDLIWERIYGQFVRMFPDCTSNSNSCCQIINLKNLYNNIKKSAKKQYCQQATAAAIVATNVANGSGPGGGDGMIDGTSIGSNGYPIIINPIHQKMLAFEGLNSDMMMMDCSGNDTNLANTMYHDGEDEDDDDGGGHQLGLLDETVNFELSLKLEDEDDDDEEPAGVDVDDDDTTQTSSNQSSTFELLQPTTNIDQQSNKKKKKLKKESEELRIDVLKTWKRKLDLEIEVTELKKKKLQMEIETLDYHNKLKQMINR